MEHSDTTSVAEVEADLAMSAFDDGPDPWPLPGTLSHPRQSTYASMKRTMARDSDDSGSAPPSSGTKSTRRDEAPDRQLSNDASLPRPLSRGSPLLPPSGASAFAPRADYVKLAFRENPSNDVKLCWLNDVTKAFCLDRDLAKVKMSTITSRFIYVSRRRQDIMDGITGGGFLS